MKRSYHPAFTHRPVSTTASHSCLHLHTPAEVGDHLLPDPGLFLESNCFLSEFTSQPRFLTQLFLSLNFRSPGCLTSCSAAGPGWLPIGFPSYRHFGFRFPGPTKSAAIHPSAFPASKNWEYLSSVVMYPNIFYGLIIFFF